jgi:hypothetical protein
MQRLDDDDMAGMPVQLAKIEQTIGHLVQQMDLHIRAQVDLVTEIHGITVRLAQVQGWIDSNRESQQRNWNLLTVLIGGLLTSIGALVYWGFGLVGDYTVLKETNSAQNIKIDLLERKVSSLEGSRRP